MSGCFPFGAFRKQNYGFIPQASEDDIYKALNKKGMFDCKAMSARISEESCISFQRKAQQEKTRAEQAFSKLGCIDCAQGKKIAKKKGATIEKRKPKICTSCGVVITSENKTVFHEIYTHHTCKACYNENQRKLSAAARLKVACGAIA